MSEIEFGIWPSCSEATIRIKTDGQNKKKLDALIKELVKRLNQDLPPSNTGDWNDEEGPEPWSEGYVQEKQIFGMGVLEITGDAPYNYGDDIIMVIKEYLPKAEIDWTEP
jgi:hypothetical protein